MSAIAGIYYLDDRSVDCVDLSRMIDILAHRGPDGSNIWCEGHIGLGHRMLWTTPESLLEELPLVNQTGDLAITADARIDNRDELIAALALNDYPSEKLTDSQLILAAYEKWGETCLEHLLGDFAFVIWDEGKQILFCARDHFGVKPFYYHSSNRAFIFATEIKALLCLPEVPRQLNEVRVVEHLAPKGDDPVITFYQDIYRLPAAHSMVVSQAGTQLRCYWTLDPSRELRLGSDKEYAEAFRQLFTEAVRCRLRSAFPVGSMLSGGLDSSSITCVARQVLAGEKNSHLHTFSAIFDEVTQCDERSFQNTVLAQGDLEPHYLHADQVSPLTDLDRLLWHQDEASDTGNLYINWCLYGSAHEQGVRVLLDGFDGDTTVSHGTGYLIELALAGRWIALGRELKAHCQIGQGPPWKQVLWRWVLVYGVDSTISKFPMLKQVRQIWRILRQRQPSTNQSAWNPILNPDFVQRMGKLYKAPLEPPKTEREHHYRLLTWALMPGILEKLDRVAAAFSVELRFPFWDKRLVEFCLSLPPQQKIHQGWTRLVMRRAMDGILPQEVQWRGDKANMAPGFDHGLLAFERERMDEVILKDPRIIEKYVDITVLREAYHRFVSGEASQDDEQAVWRTVSLALWLQRTDLTPSA